MKKKLLLTIVASLSIAVSTVGALSLASSNDFNPVEHVTNYMEEKQKKFKEMMDRCFKKVNDEIKIDKTYSGTICEVDYEPGNPKTYWLNGYPIELLNEPICFICGDVYFSENAIKTIVEAETDSTLFFCTHNNQSPFYIKHHDEPLAYKVVDYELFKKKIDETKKLKDEGMCCREPVVWELYRVINGIWVNEHKLTTNYVAINDESCDVDSKNDIKLLNKMLGGIEMIKVEALQDFTLSRFDEIENIERVRMDEKGRIFIGDKFECEKELCDYLLGANPINRPVVKVIEVIPEKIEIKEEPKQEVKTEEKITIPKKATRKRTSKK